MRKLVGVVALLSLVGCSSGGGGGSGGASGRDGAADAAADHVATGGAGGADAATCGVGNAGCACYPNDTCNGGLVCASHLCVSAADAATDVPVAGAGGGAGSSGTGGAAGGGASGATGGSAGAAGGSNGGAATGGAATGGLGNGGSAQAGSGGSAGAGQGGSPAATGGAGGGGAGGGGAGGGGAGGQATATGGAAGAGAGGAGAGGAGGAGGSALSPYLVFKGGWVSSDSNAFGIQGPLYTFSDGQGSTITPLCDASTDPCFKAQVNTGKFCVNGVGIKVPLGTGGTYDYATYWGAAVALDLNVPTAGGTRAAYVASAHGVKGFSFELTNNLPASKVRFTYHVRSGTGATDFAAYCVQELGQGKNTIHFSSAALNCYQSGGAALDAATADKLEVLQWQVPTTATVTTSYDFCIDKITPLTE